MKFLRQIPVLKWQNPDIYIIGNARYDLTKTPMRYIRSILDDIQHKNMLLSTNIIIPCYFRVMTYNSANQSASKSTNNQIVKLLTRKVSIDLRDLAYQVKCSHICSHKYTSLSVNPETAHTSNLALTETPQSFQLLFNYIAQCAINNIESLAFLQAEKLQYIDLDSNDLSNTKFLQKIYFSELKYLSIEWNHILALNPERLLAPDEQFLFNFEKQAIFDEKHLRNQHSKFQKYGSMRNHMQFSLYKCAKLMTNGEIKEKDLMDFFQNSQILISKVLLALKRKS